MENKSMYDRIQAGYYKTKLPYVAHKDDPEAYYKYHEDQNRLLKEFEHDLFEELGIQNNPKRYRLYSIAWSLGHSSGYSEVLSYAAELCPLIED